MKRLSATKLLLGAAVLGFAVPASAQLSDWRFNEIVTRTNDATAADRSQFIELHHPNADQTVDGLSIIVIRPFFGTGQPDAGPFRFEYLIDLEGTADGNFFLIGNQNFADEFGTTFSPDQVANPTDNWIMRPGGGTQGSYQEFLLVETADIDQDWIDEGVGVSGGYQFDGTEFDNGNDIIDKVYIVGFGSPGDSEEDGRFVTMDPASPQEFIANPLFEFAGAIGGFREDDGTGDWIAYDTDTDIDGDGPSTQQLPLRSSPGFTNEDASTEDWILY